MSNGIDLMDFSTFLFSIGIPILSFALGWLIPKIKHFFKFRDFKKVFGKVAVNHENLVVAVPFWKVLDAPVDTIRFRKKLLDGSFHEAYGPTETIAVADLGAIIEFEALVSNFHPRPPSYMLDVDKAIDIENKTIIAIGSPVANVRTTNFLKLSSQSFLDFFWQEESAEHPARLAIQDLTADHIYDCSGDVEYSMILRMENWLSKGAYLFIIAGPHAEGTHAAGIYLRENWKIFKKAKPNAAVLLGMPRGKFTEFHVEKTYGINIKN